MGGYARKWPIWDWGRDREQKAANKGFIVKLFTIVGNWGLILLGNSESQYGTYTSEIVHPRGTGARVFIHDAHQPWVEGCS